MSISIRMTENEKKLAQSYAKLNGMTLSESIKKVYFDAIEEEYDVSLADKAISEYKKDKKTISLDDVEKELGI
jgi:RHH-type transcriptional regulator, rel operon repressor / antitoxin RelB